MGEGRNSIYLAKLGWEVHAFDPAAAAVALANKRTQELGLKIATSNCGTATTTSGRSGWDLVEMQVLRLVARQPAR